MFSELEPLKDRVKIYIQQRSKYKYKGCTYSTLYNVKNTPLELGLLYCTHRAIERLLVLRTNGAARATLEEWLSSLMYKS